MNNDVAETTTGCDKLNRATMDDRESNTVA